jgi:chaperonin GroEL
VTTDARVAESPEKEASSGMPAGGGMGGF